MVQSVGEVRELELQRSLIGPDLYITSPLYLEHGVVAPTQQQGPGGDTVTTGASSTVGTLHQSWGTNTTNHAGGDNETQ